MQLVLFVCPLELSSRLLKVDLGEQREMAINDLAVQHRVIDQRAGDRGQDVVGVAGPRARIGLFPVVQTASITTSIVSVRPWSPAAARTTAFRRSAGFSKSSASVAPSPWSEYFVARRSTVPHRDS